MKQLACRIWKRVSSRIFVPLSAGPQQNVLEWLSARRFPDSSLTLIITFLGAMTLAPYLGGRTIWFVGTSAVTIPPVTPSFFWIIVFATPICWCLLGARLIHASPLRVSCFLLAAVSLSLLVVAGHKRYPVIALGAITPDFDNSYQVEFLETQRYWLMAHRIDSNAERYCHFKTRPISLGTHVHQGCAVRIDKIDLEAVGYAELGGESFAGFDLEVYVGTTNFPSETSECVSAREWQRVVQRPPNKEVEGRIVVEVQRTALMPGNVAKYVASYDFANKSATARPTLQWTKLISRRDILVTGQDAKLQVAGWTLWGTPVIFQLNSISARVTGRLECGFWF